MQNHWVKYVRCAMLEYIRPGPTVEAKKSIAGKRRNQEHVVMSRRGCCHLFQFYNWICRLLYPMIHAKRLAYIHCIRLEEFEIDLLSFLPLIHRLSGNLISLKNDAKIHPPHFWCNLYSIFCCRASVQKCAYKVLEPFWMPATDFSWKTMKPSLYS